jgi:thiaminase/transcriptional activator TenA
MEEMGRIAQQLAVLTGGENDYFLRAFDELGVPEEEYTDAELRPNAEAFVDFVMRVAHGGSYDEVLTVITAAGWVYLDWCEYAVEGEQDRWYLDEWAELHVVDGFVEYVEWLRDQLDERGPELSNERRARIEELFARTVELEARFFDAAYDA